VATNDHARLTADDGSANNNPDENRGSPGIFEDDENPTDELPPGPLFGNALLPRKKAMAELLATKGM
jgi:hypothetical protein